MCKLCPVDMFNIKRLLKQGPAIRAEELPSIDTTSPTVVGCTQKGTNWSKFTPCAATSDRTLCSWGAVSQ